jgi:hypothetical protein
VVYITQNDRVSGHCQSSRILNIRKHNVLETGSVSILRRGEGDALRAETDPFSEMLCFLVFRILEDGQGPETK